MGVALGFAATHVFINRQAVIVLQSDGLTAQADYVKRMMSYFNAGVCRADGGLGCMSHYYNPSTGRGLWGGVWQLRRAAASSTAVCGAGRRQAARFGAAMPAGRCICSVWPAT